MFTRTLRLWLVLASLCLMPLSGSASTSVEALLQQAEAVRSSNTTAFQSLLAQLNSNRQLATSQQREHLDYLNAYAKAYDGRYNAAIVDARRIIEKSSDPAMQFRAGALIVNGYAVTRQFTEALRQLEQTLSLVDKIKDPELRQHGLGMAALTYNRTGQYKLALHYADRILEEPAPLRALCFAGKYRLESLQNLGALPTDDVQITWIVSQCVKGGETVVANFARAILARKWVAQGQPNRAVALLQEHLVEVKATDYQLLIGEFHSLLAELLLERGDVVGAEKHAQAAIALRSTSLSNSPPLVSAYKTMYAIAERRHDPMTALAFFRRYAEADKAYLNETKARELAYQIVRQEILQKSQQIELLKGQNEVLRLQQRVERQATQNSRLMVALLVLLVTSIGYWAYKIKRMHVSLRRFAETDALTGICNRHHFTQQAEKSIARCAKAGEPVALVMFDLDHFKAINDNYGHVTGDWVLQHVADTCKAFCRPIDYIGRLGGEEFAILLHGCDLEAATRLAEDCRMRLTQIETRESGHAFSVTASFGVSAASLSGYDLAKLLSQADQMLYRAKRDGRNCVRGYATDMSFSSQTDASAPLEEASPARGGSLRSHQGLRGLGS